MMICAFVWALILVQLVSYGSRVMKSVAFLILINTVATGGQCWTWGKTEVSRSQSAKRKAYFTFSLCMCQAGVGRDQHYRSTRCKCESQLAQSGSIWPQEVPFICQYEEWVGPVVFRADTILKAAVIQHGVGLARKAPQSRLNSTHICLICNYHLQSLWQWNVVFVFSALKTYHVELWILDPFKSNIFGSKINAVLCIL